MGRPTAELEADFLRELKTHKDSTADFDLTMSCYINEHWTLEEIADYAEVFDIKSRFERAAGENWLRGYWAKWRRVVADCKSKAAFQKIDTKEILSLTPAAVAALMPQSVEETSTFQELDKRLEEMKERQSKIDRKINLKNNAKFNHKGKKAANSAK